MRDEYVVCEHCGVYTVPRCFACGRYVGVISLAVDDVVTDAEQATSSSPYRRSAAARWFRRLVLLGVIVLGASIAFLMFPVFDLEPERPDMTRFEGSDFSIDYPKDWVVQQAETVPPGAEYRDTTIKRSDGDPHFLLRVDVAYDDVSPLARARSVIAALTGEPGFREVSLRPISLRTRDGVHLNATYFEFTLDHPATGTAMHNVDVFFSVGDKGFALLTRSAQSEWSAWKDIFEDIRSSILP